MNWIDFFTDPILRGPTIASMWMCFSASLLGVIIFLRRHSLLGETLSHATYPGITLAIVLSVFFHQEEWIGEFILVGAFISALVGFWILNFIQSKLKISADASLCLVLTVFFGIGVTAASQLQFTQPQAFRQIQAYLYGQAATMTDFHTVLYGSFSFCSLLFLFLFYKELQVIAFDKGFATSTGCVVKTVEACFLVFVVLAIVMGIRSVGIVLMSAMLIAPVAAARQYTNQLSTLFTVSGVIGLASGFFGNYFSLFFSNALSSRYPDWHASLPTGPMIVLVAAFFAVISFLFAPQRGLVVRYFRVKRFRLKRKEENMLKALWRLSQVEGERIAVSDLLASEEITRFFRFLIFFRFRLKGWILLPGKNSCILTKKGKAVGGGIVRLHRLWEAYLVTHLGEGVERVHHSAEEMEHILTPEIEKQLTALLENPIKDPHAQPIPPQEEVMSHG